MLIDPFIRYICFNLLHLGVLVWLVYAGYSRADWFQVNIAFLFFGIGFLTLYFDTFWGLLQRSYFFMSAGILLLGGGFLLERNRRKLAPAYQAPVGRSRHEAFVWQAGSGRSIADPCTNGNDRSSATYALDRYRG
jgi:hypothetical protein